MSVCFKAFGDVVRRALNRGDDSVRSTWSSALTFHFGADSKLVSLWLRLGCEDPQFDERDQAFVWSRMGRKIQVSIV